MASRRRWWGSGKYETHTFPPNDRQLLVAALLLHDSDHAPVWLEVGVPRVVAVEAAQGLPVLAELAGRLRVFTG